MRSIIYAAYSKDLSVKTTSAKIQMMKQGKPLSARKTLSLLRRSFEVEDGIPRASSMTIRSRDSSAAETVNVL